MKRVARTASNATATCRCGHSREAHEHFRHGTDCSLGTPGHCTKFRRQRRSAADTVPDTVVQEQLLTQQAVPRKSSAGGQP